MQSTPGHPRLINVVPGYVMEYDVSLFPPVPFTAGDMVMNPADTNTPNEKVLRRFHCFNLDRGREDLKAAHTAWLDANVLPDVLKQEYHVRFVALAADRNLAFRRAKWTYDFLVDARLVAPECVGFEYLVLPADESSGRSKDRRVTFLVLDPTPNTVREEF